MNLAIKLILAVLTIAAAGCSSSSNATGTSAGSQDVASTDTAAACQSASFSVLVGSCTLSSSLGCTDYYAAAAETPANVAALSGACATGAAGITGTWATAACDASLTCHCSNSSGAWRMVTSTNASGTLCASTCKGNCRAQQ